MKLLNVYKSTTGVKVEIAFTTGELIKISAMMQNFLNHNQSNLPQERVILNKLKKVVELADSKIENVQYPNGRAV